MQTYMVYGDPSMCRYTVVEAVYIKLQCLYFHNYLPDDGLQGSKHVEDKGKGKGHPGTVQGGPRGSGQFKALDFLDVRHYKGGRSSPICTGRLYPRRNPWYSFSGAESTPGHIVPSWGATEKIPIELTPPVIDPGTVQLVVQCLNHYATSGPHMQKILCEIKLQQMCISLVLHCNNCNFVTNPFMVVLTCIPQTARRYIQILHKPTNFKNTGIVGVLFQESRCTIYFSCGASAHTIHGLQVLEVSRSDTMMQHTWQNSSG